MRNNVSYAECTCDLCGKIERIPQSLILPKGWGRIEIHGSKKDACEECIKKVEGFLKSLYESKV